MAVLADAWSKNASPAATASARRSGPRATAATSANMKARVCSSVRSRPGSSPPPPPLLLLLLAAPLLASKLLLCAPLLPTAPAVCWAPNPSTAPPPVKLLRARRVGRPWRAPSAGTHQPAAADAAASAVASVTELPLAAGGPPPAASRDRPLALTALPLPT